MSEERAAHVLSAVGSGGRTWQIAKRLGWQGTALARRYLNKLEANGMVKRHPHYTASNDIYWIRNPTP